jgi:ADP-ribose pyrophosphatase YjhB (NUDIX family)
VDKVTKINENLYYDERSAGGIVFAMVDGKVQWLVIKTLSRRSPNKVYYKFPKGHLKSNEFLKAAALREVEEEAKVKATIVTKLGSNDYIIWDKLQKRKIVKRVTFFLMEYEGESNLKYYDQEKVIGKEWMDYDQACKSLAYDSEKILLGKARAKLDGLVNKRHV